MPSYIQKRVGKKGTSWRVRFPIADEDGAITYHTKTFDYQRQAKEYLDELKDAQRSGSAVVESEQTLRDYFERVFLPSLDIRDRTREDYKAHFERYIKPRLGSVQLKNLSPRRVQSLYNHLKNDSKLSPRTIRLTHSILHSSLDHAVSLRMIRTNPSKGVKLPRKQDSDISFLQGDELAEFMTQLKGNMYAPLFEFMLATGCRPGEARAVMWSDIDWKKKTVYIQRSVTDQTPYVFTEPKTSKGKRSVSLPDKTLDRLKAHKADQGKERLEAGPDWSNLDLIFCDSKGGPLDRRNLANKHLKKILKATAEKLHPSKKGEAYKRILGCSLYSLRHTSATTLIERGVNLRTVSERLGHKDVETTLSVYVHHTKAMEEQATEEISKALYR